MAEAKTTIEESSATKPEFKEHEPGHWAACHLLDS